LVLAPACGYPAAWDCPPKLAGDKAGFRLFSWSFYPHPLVAARVMAAALLNTSVISALS